MSDSNVSGPPTWKRRQFLKSTGIAGVAGFLPVGTASAAGDSVVIGDFETSLDGWQSNGGVALDRVSASEFEPAVTSGNYGLAVSGRGDSYPLVWNSSTFADAPVETHPYLLADVATTGFEGSDAGISVTFRYHYDRGRESESSGSNGRGNGTPSNGTEGADRGRPVVESEPIRVPRFTNTTIAFDLSELTRRQRRNPRRIDIAWHPADVEPKTGPAGRGPERVGESYVYLDDIHLTDAVSELSSAVLETRLRSLRARHGLFEYEFLGSEDGSEVGRLAFGDGTSIPTTFTVVGDDQFEYEIGDETYRIGGGWDE